MPEDIIVQDNTQAPVQAPNQEQAQEQQGELILGKFKSHQDLAKAYQELERKMGKSPSSEEFQAEIEKGASTDGEQKDGEAAQDQPTEEQAAEALTVAGLDMSEFTTEWEKSGKLSDESYAKLEAAGFPRWAVDGYIRGSEASRAEAQVAEAKNLQLMEAAGGKDAYMEMISWASKSLSAPEIDAYNRIMSSGDEGSIRWAVEGLKTKYVNSTGSEPKLLKGDGTQAVSERFNSAAEVTAAMRDPRYRSDPAYRAEVYAKLRSSPGVAQRA